jgi:hypothetical protein
MNRIKIIIIILFSIVMGSSCTKEIEFNANLLEPKLVVNALCNLDSILEVEVSANKPIPGFETKFQLITDASVKLFVDGTETDQLVYKSLIGSDNQTALYVSKTKVESGKLYKLEVGHKDFKKTATGEMILGKQVPVINVTTEPIVNTDLNSGNQQKIKASLKFSDPADEENYYRLEIGYRIGESFSHPVSNGDTVNYVQVMDYSFNYTGIESDDPVFSSNDNADEMLFESSNSGFTLFSDELFNGKTYDLTFFLNQSILYDIQKLDFAKGDFYIITFQLQNLTKDAYYYFKSVGSFGWYSEGLFSEPVQVYNNINNGLGIFGGYSSSIFKLQKGEYPVEGVEYYYGMVSY